MCLKRIRNTFLAIGLFATSQLMATPNHIEMEYLGKTKVQNIFSDSDIINFGNCGGASNGFIQKIQLRVDSAPVEIEDLVIEYGNGEKDRLAVRERFEPGTVSRLIDLNKGSRCVTRAFVRARTLGIFNEGIISFYGYRQVGVNSPNSGYGRFLLGHTNLDSIRDADRIFVSRCDRNSFVIAKQLQVLVTGNNAKIEELVITFGNGEVTNIPVREFFLEKSWSSIKDLPGNQRCIREIFVLGRTQNSRYNSGKAIVDIYGIR